MAGKRSRYHQRRKSTRMEMTHSPARAVYSRMERAGTPLDRSENPRARVREREANESKLPEPPMRTNFVTISRTINCGLRGCSNSNGCGFCRLLRWMSRQFIAIMTFSRRTQVKEMASEKNPSRQSERDKNDETLRESDLASEHQADFDRDAERVEADQAKVQSRTD